MKKLFTLLALLAVSFTVLGQRTPEMFAHRGCWSKDSAGEFVVPENSVAAVKMAARMGYKGIECDVRMTKDGRMVILHDKTLNRTMRRAADYSPLTEKIYLKDLTFEQLRRDYVLKSTDPALRTPIPTLEEILEQCKRQGLVPMLHSSVEESYRVAQSMFGDEWICFTTDYELLKRVRDYSACTILYAINSGTVEQILPRLQALGGECGVSTMKHKLYTPEFCRALTEAGYKVQASIFKSPREVVALRNGITHQLTDFSIMPEHKPYDKFRIRKQKSAAYRWADKKECGAITVDIEYQGVIEVVVNGNRVYTLSRETLGNDKIGNRFFNLAPSIKIVAGDSAVIKRATARVFEY